jgi:VCBS repeat-containing protein
MNNRLQHFCRLRRDPPGQKQIVHGPSHGTLSLNASTGAYIYTPAANYNGTDAFTFKVNDGTTDSAVATLSLTVNAVNDAPTLAQALVDQQVANDQTLKFTVPLTSFSDVDDASLIYSAKTGLWFTASRLAGFQPYRPQLRGIANRYNNRHRVYRLCGSSHRQRRCGCQRQ